jgi:hypothetical protein
VKVGRSNYGSEVVSHGLEVGNTMNVNWRRFSAARVNKNTPQEQMSPPINTEQFGRLRNEKLRACSLLV